MKLLLLLSLLFQVSCATKYIVPGNRFMTPETQGGALRGQFEFQITNATQMAIDTSNGDAENGVLYEETSRVGFLLSSSFFDSFDLFWAHVGSANSLIGAKVQFIGDPRISGSAGHKLAIAAAVGGNEHETDDEAVKFELSGKEFMLLYGYRINANILPYTNLSYAKYDFEGNISSSDPMLNGLRPKFETTILSLSGGVELTYDVFFAKLEGTYQQLETTDTKNKSRLILGYSLGLNW